MTTCQGAGEERIPGERDPRAVALGRDPHRHPGIPMAYHDPAYGSAQLDDQREAVPQARRIGSADLHPQVVRRGLLPGHRDPAHDLTRPGSGALACWGAGRVLPPPARRAPWDCRCRPARERRSGGLSYALLPQKRYRGSFSREVSYSVSNE